MCTVYMKYFFHFLHFVRLHFIIMMELLEVCGEYTATKVVLCACTGFMYDSWFVHLKVISLTIAIKIHNYI